MRRIKFYGIGGQGAVTAAKVLSQAVSIYQDEYAITVPAYGRERRGFRKTRRVFCSIENCVV